MSYLSAIRTGDDVLVWERDDEGRKLSYFRAPYYFYIEDPDGEYTSMFGQSLSRKEFDNAREYQRARSDCEAQGIRMFESDIPAELKVLSEQYYGEPAPKTHITFFDIEVDYDKEIGFASVQNPYAPINSVALYHTHQKRYAVYAIPPNLAARSPTDHEWKKGFANEDFIKQLNDIAELPKDVDIVLCANEQELLAYFLAEIEDSDVVSGWNSDFFDVPYTGARLEKLGKKWFRRLCFAEAEDPKWREIERFGTPAVMLDLSGRNSVDYLELFRKYEMEERQSYTLESTANEILPDLPKLEYEGSLADLYRNDFVNFVRYNLRDTEVLHGLEDKLGYVHLADQMIHLSTGLWKHALGVLKLAELAMINYCHHELDNTIVSDFKKSDEDRQIKGALVLLPQVGMHQWVGSIDINSLYPSAIRSINISPETIVGQFIDEIEAAEQIAADSDVELIFLYEDQQQEKLTAAEWRRELKKRKWAVSGFGTVFNQSKQGIIPKILETWYLMRKEYQKKYSEAKSAGDESLATYYDRIQYVYKIKLNSFYGALSNQYFRFYDLRMGESTTGTGRAILRHQCAEVCKLLDGKYTLPDREVWDKDRHGDQVLHKGYTDKHSVVYGDTDSSYFVTHAKDQHEALLVADLIGQQVNDSFQKFMQDTFLCHPGFDDIIKCGREVVSDRAIFVDKKRYIMHLVDKDGYKVDKLKVMGLETKKTILPKHVSNKLNGFVERLLKDEPWRKIADDIVAYKEELRTTEDIMSIGLPKGVKKVEHYTREYKSDPGTRLPGHVAASIFYNICIDQFNDRDSMPIVSGTKIRVFYLTKKYGRFKSIAIPVDIERVPKWFLNNFQVLRDAHVERLVDKPLNNIIKAIDREVPTKQSLLVEDLIVF